MEKIEFNNERLQKILEKRKNYEQLTKEEELFVTDTLNKLLESKKSLRKNFQVTTGDELRKQNVTLPSPKRTGSFFEGPLPKARGMEGGYDSKANVKERESVTPDSGTDVDSPTTKVPDQQPPYKDQKEEKLPKENTEGKPYGDQTEEEWADADNKPFERTDYEEDRIGRYTERANYKDSIKVKDIVIKSMGSNKLVGFVLKVYPAKINNQLAAMVKWCNGTFSHENTKDLQVLKADGDKSDKAKKEEEKVSPPVVKKGVLGDVVRTLGTSALEGVGIGAGISAIESALKPKKPKQLKQPMIDTEKAVTPKEFSPTREATGTNVLVSSGKVTPLPGSDEYIEIKNSDKKKVKKDGAETDVPSDESNQEDDQMVPPAIWLQRCKESLHAEAQGQLQDDELQEVCLEAWRAFMSGDITPMENEQEGNQMDEQTGEQVSPKVTPEKVSQKADNPATSNLKTQEDPAAPVKKEVEKAVEAGPFGETAGPVHQYPTAIDTTQYPGGKKPTSELSEAARAANIYPVSSDYKSKSEKVAKDGTMSQGTRIPTTFGTPSATLRSPGITTTFGSKTTEDTEKAEQAPSDWMEQCKAALEREGSDVDNPFAVCQATYNKMKNKGILEGNIIKISADDMESICPPCAKKMRAQRLKFYKFTIADLIKYLPKENK